MAARPRIRLVRPPRYLTLADLRRTHVATAIMRANGECCEAFGDEAVTEMAIGGEMVG